MFCKNCGASLNDTDLFCKECGSKTNKENEFISLNSNNIPPLKIILLSILSFLFPLFGFIFLLVKKDLETDLTKNIKKWSIIGIAIQIGGLILGLTLIFLLASFFASMADDFIMGVYDFMSTLA